MWHPLVQINTYQDFCGKKTVFYTEIENDCLSNQVFVRYDEEKWVSSRKKHFMYGFLTRMSVFYTIQYNNKILIITVTRDNKTGPSFSRRRSQKITLCIIKYYNIKFDCITYSCRLVYGKTACNVGRSKYSLHRLAKQIPSLNGVTYFTRNQKT